MRAPMPGATCSRSLMTRSERAPERQSEVRAAAGVCEPVMPSQSPEIGLRPFGRADFDRLISWVDSAAAVADWCAAFFVYPLDHAQLTRYLQAAERPQGPVIFT